MSRRDPYEFAPPQPPVQVDSDGNSDHRSYETTQKALPGSNVYGGKTILVKTWLKAKGKKTFFSAKKIYQNQNGGKEKEEECDSDGQPV